MRPRIITFSNEGRSVLTYNSPHSAGGNTLEMSFQNPKTKKVEGYSVTFLQGNATLEGPNPQRCMECHGTPSGDFVNLWGDYLKWPGSMAIEDALTESEAKLLADFYEEAKSEPRYKQILQIRNSQAADYPYSSGRFVNTDLTRFLSRLRIESLRATFEKRAEDLPSRDLIMYAFTAFRCASFLKQYGQNSQPLISEFLERKYPQCEEASQILASQKQRSRKFGDVDNYEGQELIFMNRVRLHLTGDVSYHSRMSPDGHMESASYNTAIGPALTLEGEIARILLEKRKMTLESDDVTENETNCTQMIEWLHRECSELR